MMLHCTSHPRSARQAGSSREGIRLRVTSRKIHSAIDISSKGTFLSAKTTILRYAERKCVDNPELNQMSIASTFLKKTAAPVPELHSTKGLLTADYKRRCLRHVHTNHVSAIAAERAPRYCTKRMVFSRSPYPSSKNIRPWRPNPRK